LAFSKASFSSMVINEFILESLALICFMLSKTNSSLDNFFEKINFESCRQIYKTKYSLVKKQNLPSKICPVCKRPFVWRKKWKLNWERVKYCSKKCSKLS